MKQNVLLLFALLVSTTMAWADDSGTCGTNVNWTLTGTELTISGTGAMTNYDPWDDNPSPWYENSYITSVTIGEGVTSIGDYAFYYCSDLTSVTIGSGVTSIGNYAFSSCSGLTSVTIPNSVTSIGFEAFGGCSGLTSVTIGSGVTSIGNYAFSSCSKLTSVTIPNSVTSIGESAFSGCSGLTSVTIDSGVTSIGNYAFLGCSKLSSITIPSTVTSIGCDAFNNTPWWNTYKENTEYQYGNIIYINNVAYKAVSDDITSCTFKDGTVSIGDDAFIFCSGLTSVTIPNSVTSIGSSAFYFCSGLTSVTIPNSVTSIGSSAFSHCSGLTSVTIPNSVTSIGDMAFIRCRGLTSVTIPSSVTSIGDYAFGYCSNLVCVTVWATTPPSIGSQVFYKGSGIPLPPIYVPSGSVDTYKEATNWSYYKDIITAIPTSLTANEVNGSYWATFFSNIANVQVDENTTIYTINKVSGTTATLGEVSNRIIKAGQGVILKSTAGSIGLTYTSDAATDADYTSNLLKGVDAVTPISGSAYADKVIYTMACENSALGFYKYYDNVSDTKHTANTTLGANKAFLALDAAAAARGFAFQFGEDIPTAIDEELNVKGQESAPAVYYNLNGQKVEKPTRGLYIVRSGEGRLKGKNGKKVFVK